ncbi:MAG: hypothetical protein WBO23_13225 [Burkholderiales bacterium]
MDNPENHAGKSGSFSLLAWAVLSFALCCVAILLMPAQQTYDASGAGAASSAPSAVPAISDPDASIGPEESGRCRGCTARSQDGFEAPKDRGNQEIMNVAIVTVRIALAAFLAWGGVLSLLWLARDASDRNGS